MMRAINVLLFLLPLSLLCGQTPSSHDLYFEKIPAVWDEGIPLGNGLMGCLVWQKEPGKIRLALDRADLWDLRPVAEMQDTVRFRYAWVQEQLRNNQYAAVQKQFDEPYEREPGPTKIPAAALEFSYKNTQPIGIRLYLREALCVVEFSHGERLLILVNASSHTGHWRFEHGSHDRAEVMLVPPAYAAHDAVSAANSVEGHSLQRLGYSQGPVTQSKHTWHYTQQGWGGFHYEVAVRWRDLPAAQEGAWSISAHYPDRPAQVAAAAAVRTNHQIRFKENFDRHRRWWADFWEKSAVHLPDDLLEKQWYLEQYKLGSASRRGAPPISLQAVWTADNGQLPPWKGDFHNDLNTQMSYWSAYGANHVEEARTFLDWLCDIRPAARRFATQYFGTQNGLQVPGVCTLRGEPMGGWIQYAFSATASAWLSQHFWNDWRYTRDEVFFQQKGRPWITEAGQFLAELTIQKGREPRFDLPLSTSPEIHDNAPEAYFKPITHFDLSLTRYLFEKNVEAAGFRRNAQPSSSEDWKARLRLLPTLDTDSTGLTIAPGHPHRASHRHFSHLMAIYPLGLLQFERDSALMTRSVRHLERLGTSEWTGYSYAWMGCLEARLRDGHRARQYLHDFARAFCLPNSFHVNGDQTKSGLSNLQYRPFTLEGNFAFAAGVQEMLLQSYEDVLRVFPAIPADWKDVSFENLRAEGAFLVSAGMEKGHVVRLTVLSEKGGELKIFNLKTARVERYQTTKGQAIELIH